MEILTVRRVMLSLIAMTAFMAQPASPQADNLEYRVKAAFLFNFLKFVEWPAGGGGVWVIGVVGPDPFAQILEETVRGKSINGRPIEVRRFTRPGLVKDCHILFIGRAEAEKMATISHQIPVQAGVLTVGESPEFLERGGAVNFYLEDSKVHFEIKAASARAAGLRVSSQLLKLGKAL